MYEQEQTKEEQIKEMLLATDTEGIGEHLKLCLDEMINLDIPIPMLHSKYVFLDFLMAYYLREEEYELCDKLQKHRPMLEKKICSFTDIIEKFDDGE